MSGVGLGLPQPEESAETSTAGIMESTMMEGEEYYNPDETGTWTHKETTDQLCRICAKPNQYLIPIFEGEGIEHQLEPKIQKHLPIEVYESDELPLQVCYQCASTLIAWNDLVIACIEADKKLRQMQEQEEEDEDNKGAEFFDEPAMDSDIGDDEPSQPSTSTATVTSNKPEDTPLPKKAVNQAKKPKLKMVLVKNPTAGPSGVKNPPKKSLSKSKEVASQDATERCLILSTSSPSHTREQNPSNTKNRGDDFDCSLFVKTEIDLPSSEEIFCIHCGYAFTSKNELATHVAAEHNANVFHCDLCDELFEASKQDFIEHMNGHVERDSTKARKQTQVRRSQSCSVCNKRFVRGFDLKRHMKVHISDRVYPCSICFEVFATRFHLVAHRKTHVPDNLLSGSKEQGFPCTICGRTLSRKYDLRRHIIQTHSLSPNDVIQSENGVAAGQDNDSGGSKVAGNKDASLVKSTEKIYPCTVCSRSFSRHFDMLRHRKLHEDCDGNFSEPQMEEGDHLIKHTQLPPAPRTRALYSEEVDKAKFVVDGMNRYHCEQCNQIIITRYNFVRHLRIHTGEKPFTCHVCGKQFRTSLQLNRHFKDVHLGIKNYTCDICFKTFASSSARNDHRFIHFDKRSFICHVCGKAYKTRSCLNVHSRFHKDTIKHDCPHCERKFRTIQNLTSHIRVHTGEKPHPCGICGKPFRTTSQLNNHVLIHTSTSSAYHCSVCQKSFALERYLRNHMRQNHRHNSSI